MPEPPFQILIKNTNLSDKDQTITCTVLLRSVPSRRHVYDALWDNQPVIVKIFSHKINVNRHLKREWKGLRQLQNKKLSAPKPLFYGDTENGSRVIVIEKIVKASSAFALFVNADSHKEKLDLVLLICKELADQHEKGVLQKDLHLDNYLVKDNTVFMLDPAQIKFAPKPLDKSSSLSQVALLARYFPDSDTDSMEKLYQKYAKTRNWDISEEDKAFMKKHLRAHRTKTIEKGLKKTLRTGKRNIRVSTSKYCAMFDKSFCLENDPLDLIEQIDSLMDAGDILKNGNTCYVSRFKWNNKDIVVKRYNNKGFVHSLRHTLKGSRAKRSWLHAQRLLMLSINTPKPCAYIEHYKGLLLWRSYIVTEYVDAQKFYYFLRDEKLSEKQKAEVTEQVKDMINELGSQKISHGDLKHSNILVADDGPYITDLDSMIAHKCSKLFEIKRKKDLARFNKFFP